MCNKQDPPICTKKQSRIHMRCYTESRRCDADMTLLSISDSRHGKVNTVLCEGMYFNNRT